jgi:RimJ/RimL family protein N-acetyltransferase
VNGKSGDVADPIGTSRLDLVPMTPAFLAASLQEDRAQLGLTLGIATPDDWPDEPRWPQRWLEQLREDPDLQPWLLRAIVLRDERRMIGHIGFHARPGGDHLRELAPAGVEFRYTVFERDRRQGYAREACEALMEWAHRSHGVTRFVLSISPSNIVSLELAEGLGFDRIGSHVDEEDGPEDIFECRMLG